MAGGRSHHRFCKRAFSPGSPVGQESRRAEARHGQSLAFIAKHRVDDPEQVTPGRKNGRTTQALRTLLSAVAPKEWNRAILEIAD